MWASPGNAERCPVQIYKLYKSLRPHDYCSPATPFYLACTTVKDPPPGTIWFKRAPVGIHKLESTMKTMAAASSHKKLTNHSARKHLIQTLRDSNIPATRFESVFGSSIISGGTFHVNVNYNFHSTARPRRPVIQSDSDCD